jgi:cysteine desulfurase / selenocysteine lyase
MNIEEIRKQFPILQRKVNEKPLIYFDSAATTQKPQQMIDAISNYYQNSNANVHRSLHTLASESTNLWHEAHKEVADFLNAENEEIIFTKNATESLNFVANTYGRQYLKEGDVVVISELEHHSNILPWLQLAKEKKLKLEWIPVLEDYTLDINYLDYLILKYKSRLKILSISHASNILGIVNDVEKLAKKIHSVGGVLCVDAAQTVAHIPVDVKKLDCDFLCFSAHKMYGPMGIGAVYGKKEILEKLEPWITGGSIVSKVWKNGANWAELPQRFEAGTANVADAVGFLETLRWLKKYSWQERQEHEKKLISIAIASLSTICSLEFLGTKSSNERIGVVSFRLKDIHPHDIATLLDERGIAIRAGFHCAEPLHAKFDFGPSARISFGIYNTQEEVKILTDAVKYISNNFKK